MSLTGRHRGKEHSDEDLRLEGKAKGHELEEAKEGADSEGQEKPILNENFGHRERGHQKGFGKNQGKEGRDMSTGIGTRSIGAEHN